MVSSEISPSSSPIIDSLNRIDRRLGIMRLLREGALLLCAVLFAWVIARALVLTAQASPVLWALILLTGLLGGLAMIFLLVKEHTGAKGDLARAAVMGDTRAKLQDELTSAYWFLREPRKSNWVRHHVQRASETARKLDERVVVPWEFPRSTWAAGGFGVLLVVLSGANPLILRSSQALKDSNLSIEEVAKAKAIRLSLAQAGDSEAAKKLEQALAALERKNASDEERRKALAEAKEAVEKSNMEMNSMREGLMQLAERLRNSKEKSSAVDEKKIERADRAKELLDRMLEQQQRQSHSQDLDPEALAREKELERLLEQAGHAIERGDGQHIESAKAKEVVDRLEKIAQQLDTQGRMNDAARELTQMQLNVQQRSVQSAGRYSTAQQSPPTGSPSPDTGNTVMSGGIMFRTAAVARDTKSSVTQEGSKSGAAAGESQADPVIGQKTTPLAVQLKKEGIRKEGDDGESGAEGWFYAESREQKSQIALQAVRASTRYTQAEAMDPETISLKHRQVVKDYFLNLHDNPRESKPQ